MCSSKLGSFKLLTLEIIGEGGGHLPMDRLETAESKTGASFHTKHDANKRLWATFPHFALSILSTTTYMRNMLWEVKKFRGNRYLPGRLMIIVVHYKFVLLRMPGNMHVETFSHSFELSKIFAGIYATIESFLHCSQKGIP